MKLAGCIFYTDPLVLTPTPTPTATCIPVSSTGEGSGVLSGYCQVATAPPTNTPRFSPTPTSTPIATMPPTNTPRPTSIPTCRVQEPGESPYITQDMLNMQAILHVTNAADNPTLQTAVVNGLTVHAGPTLNAMRLGILPWNTPIQPTETVILTSQSGIVQHWYKVRLATDGFIAAFNFGHLASIDPAPTEGWIVGEWTAGEQVYTYVDMSAPDCQEPPLATTFTFYYDRQRTAAYAIAQAYANGRGTNPPAAQQVTSQVASYPYTNFSYPSLTGNTGATGSALFISETVWIGGFPSTQSFGTGFVSRTYCNEIGDPNLLGWRYCQPAETDDNLADASKVWVDHREIVGYYFQNWDANYRGSGMRLADRLDITDQTSWITRRSVVLLSPDNEYPYENQGNAIFNTNVAIENSLIGSLALQPGTAHPWYVAVQDINSFFLDGVTTGNIEEAKIPAFYSWATTLTELIKIKAGDYLYINSYDSSIPGSDNHGFIIIGWGPIQDCATAVHSTLEFGTDIQMTHYTDSIPYIADYSGTVPYNLQTPVPRPFYCSAYNDLTTPEKDFFTIGHVWFFFTMPDRVHLDISRLYGSP